VREQGAARLGVGGTLPAVTRPRSDMTAPLDPLAPLAVPAARCSCSCAAATLRYTFIAAALLALAVGDSESAWDVVVAR
jgi:hypothetical protein